MKVEYWAVSLADVILDGKVVEATKRGEDEIEQVLVGIPLVGVEANLYGVHGSFTIGCANLADLHQALGILRCLQPHPAKIRRPRGAAPPSLPEAPGATIPAPAPAEMKARFGPECPSAAADATHRPPVCETKQTATGLHCPEPVTHTVTFRGKWRPVYLCSRCTETYVAILKSGGTSVVVKPYPSTGPAAKASAYEQSLYTGCYSFDTQDQVDRPPQPASVEEALNLAADSLSRLLKPYRCPKCKTTIEPTVQAHITHRCNTPPPPSPTGNAEL